MRPHHAMFALVVAGSALATGALAATRWEQTMACKGDVFRYCRPEIPNEARIAICMKQHLRRLTPRCAGMFR